MNVIGSIKEFNRYKEDWFLYRERLEQYFEANEINDLKRRVSILLTLLDRETYEILHNQCYPELLREKTYNQLCNLLEHHFYQKISVLHERVRFYSLRQNSEETIVDWQVRIKKASEKCKFENNLNGILVDKFVSGLYNSKIIDCICEEEFSESKNLNDWLILVLQFENKLNNKSFRSGTVISQSSNFQNYSKGAIKDENNYNFNRKINNEKQNFDVNRINASQAISLSNTTILKTEKPYIRITEQPTSSIRFRYACEGRCAGSVLGVSSTPKKKTYLTIEIVGFREKAIAIVSCVTSKPPYRPHPYQLVGKSGCKKGVCVIDIPSNTTSIAFPNLGIQCIKRKDIEASMKMREDIRVDPYNTGFYYKHENENLYSLRLCIQVFLENADKKKIPLSPVVTNPIYDKKMKSDLVITKMSQCVMTVDGGKNKIILLCEKIIKDDIQIRFYEEVEGQVVWENFGKFNEDDVHKNVALSFKVPKYKDLNITKPITVYIQLKRPSDGETSEPLPFQYYPIHSELEVTKRKRYDFDDDLLKKEYLTSKPNFQQQRDETQTNFAYMPVSVNQAKEGTKNPVQPYCTPINYLPSNWNSNLYRNQYALSNLSTQSALQTPPSTVACHNNLLNYNIPIDANHFQFNNEVEASCPNTCIGSSFNNYIDVSQPNDLNNINLSEMSDLTQFNIEQLSDQFINSLSLENIPS